MIDFHTFVSTNREKLIRNDTELSREELSCRSLIFKSL